MVKALGQKAVTTVRFLQLWLACLKSQNNLPEGAITRQNPLKLSGSLIRGFSEILLINIIRPLFMVLFVDLSESFKSATKYQ